jgi:hypothetical protein
MSISVERRIELEKERRETLRLAQVQAEGEALREVCQQRLQEALALPLAAQQLAAAGLSGCAAGLAALRSQGTGPDQALAESKALLARIEVVLSGAEAGARAWTEERTAAVAQARVALAQAQRAASVASGTSQPARQRAEAAGELARHALAAAQAGDNSEARRLSGQALEQVEQASRLALEERVRREVVRGLLATLTEQGFIALEPRLDDGVVVLEGHLASGRRARFEVKLDGETSFDLDGYEGRACAKDLEKIETTLRDRMGMKLGPPQVFWKNPDRLSKGALSLPTGAPSRRNNP